MKMKKLLVTTVVALSLMIPTIASASSSFTSGTRWSSANSAYAWASYDYHTVYAKLTWGTASTPWSGGWGNTSTISISYLGGGSPYAQAYYQ